MLLPTTKVQFTALRSLSTVKFNEALSLYKLLLRKCEKLPEGPKEHYKFMIKQSYKQHVNEKDPERIQQIIKRAHEDSEWILNKYLSDKKP